VGSNVILSLKDFVIVFLSSNGMYSNLIIS